ncbi:uncharacterized protein LOC128215598 isoform X2 [Mya arenaria]|uniref:uncharacterized protein LOC128215598 isoform X2 n=1 Tax=Mya arenaria TaxID=6604 RepID=UPI0022E7C761|nr:uncharacterized protein LOC128215598 isoform X2 [Mya arenaria]
MVHTNMTRAGHNQMEMDYMQQGNISHEHMMHEKMGHDHMMHEKMDHDHMMHEKMGHEHMIHEKMDHEHMIHGNMDHEHMMHGNMGHEHMMHGNMGHNKMHHMSPYFTLQFQGDFLIKDVKISAPSGQVLAMILVMVLTALLEGINYCLHLQQAARRAGFANKSKRSSSLVDGSLHVLYAVHKMLTVALSYTVMLCVMTMNAWILVAAVIGAGVGYLLLRPAVASCFPVSVPVKNVKEVKVAANDVNGTDGTEEGEMDSFLEEDDSKKANDVIHNNFPTDGLLQNYTCVETV